MSKLVVVIVGDDWPAAADLEDNRHLSVDSAKPLADYADEICTLLGIDSISDVTLYQGIGALPDVTPGDPLNISNSPQDEGFTSPTLAEGDEQMCVVFAKRNAGEANEEKSSFDPVAAAKTIMDAVKGLGTNEKAIFATIDSLKDASDWEAMVAVFQDNHSDCSGGDLVKALKDDLTDSEMQQVEDKLKAKGINMEGPNEQPTAEAQPEPAAEASGGGDAEPEAEPEPEPEPESDVPSKCPDCANDYSQPFCGLTGKPHVKPAPAAKEQKENSSGEPFGQFSTDRACTQCGDGLLDDDARQAVFVCIDCDGKFCEVCWGYEHRNPKRMHHQQYLLYYECDLCPAGGTQHAALWYCDACRLLLCKQCWWNEHKNPKRRDHYKQFLYPGMFISCTWFT
eukprot:TRINITY_DN2455_c0_g1_i2.p1 TRINITY_DN2455_c0_g1~~TRINITY_DN2455_c0_g1_i2.p1  ORF type:complete len:408 (+),score=57.71 TRINITY_DN2455_c0_g1_i2:37-1224(+)